MELLEKCEFKGGIVNGLPSDVRVVHKFGESGTPVEMQLHESAIIYDKDKTYLLTVMTKGKDNKSLSSLISKISELVHKNIMNVNSVSMASL
jgi:beta-lactamase class A